MKRLLFLLLLIPVLSFGQKALTFEGKVITYQGSTSLLDAGKGMFDSGTESWAALGTNTIANDAGALKITYGDNASGARVYLNQATGDLNIDLTIGKTYKIVAKAKVNTGSVLMQHYNGSAYVSFGTVSSTSYALFTGTFVAAHATACSFVMSGMGAGEIIWIDQWYIVEVRQAPTLTATTVFKDGDVRCMKFDGATSKVDCGDPDDLTGDKTFAAWIKPYSLGEIANGRIVNNGKLILWIQGNNRFAFRSDGLTSAISADYAVDLDMWQFVCVTRTSAGVANIYKNATLTGSADQSSGTPVAGTTNLTIGNDASSATGWDGLIGPVKIYEGILTAEEISQLHSSERQKYNV